MNKNKRCFALVLILALSLIAPACDQQSQILTALDAITIAAQVLPATIPNMSPAARAWITQIPTAVICVSDIVQKGAGWPAAETCVLQLQRILDSAPIQASIPPREYGIIQGVVSAAQSFIRIYRERVTPPPGAASSPRATVHKDEQRGASLVRQRAEQLQSQLKK